MTFTRRRLDALNQILVDAARREIMPRFRNLAAGDVRQKLSPIDLVTEADEAAERFIFAELAKTFPDALLIGEESIAADPALLASLATAELAFVVDPIDGTLNYASDLPLFAVMAAAIVRGEIVASVIHDPVVNDSALALRGEGAWMARSDGSTRDLRVAPAAPLADMTGMTGWQYFAEPMRSNLLSHFPDFAAVSALRCCGHEYRLAARGGCHFLLYNAMNPWDHAPGALLCAEAGGCVRLLDGAPYTVGPPRAGLLSAPDDASWREIRERLVS